MKNKEKLIIINGELEYRLHTIYKANGTLLKLKFSESSCWADHLKGKTALKVFDDGNSIKILGSLDPKNIDYCKAYELALLLNETMDVDHNKIEYINVNKNEI